MSVKNTSEQKVSLKACDSDKCIEVSLAVAQMSDTVKIMLEDFGNSTETQTIPMTDINYETLSKVVQYCEHHVDDVKPEDEKVNRNNTISEWDQEFYKVDQALLFKIILAANFLHIKSLLELGCKTVANSMKGKSTEELRTMFGIVNDLSLQEQEKIKEEHKWVDEK